MSDIYFVYDQQGNITTAQTTYPQVTPPVQLFVAYDTTPNASAALAQRQNYMIQNGQIVPCATLDIERTSTVTGRWTTYAITVTASDAGSHVVTLSIGSHTQQVTTPATVNVDLHQSLGTVHVPIVGSGQGLVTRETFIGGNTTGATQIYQPTTGNLKIAPSQKAYLQAYYANILPPTQSMADLATLVGMAVHTIYDRILPALTSGATPLLTLTGDEENGRTDLVTNVLNNVKTTLSNAAPVPATGVAQTYDLHYGSVRNNYPTVAEAFDDYVDDVNSIPNLV